MNFCGMTMGYEGSRFRKLRVPFVWGSLSKVRTTICVGVCMSGPCYL